MPFMGHMVRGRARRSSHALSRSWPPLLRSSMPVSPLLHRVGALWQRPGSQPGAFSATGQARVTPRSPLSRAHSTSNEVSAVFLSFGERRWRGSWVALRTQVGAIVPIGALAHPGALVTTPAPWRPLRSRRWWCEAGQVGESGQRGGAGLVGCLDSDKPSADLCAGPAAALEDLQAACQCAGNHARMIPDRRGKHVDKVGGIDQRVTCTSSSWPTRRRGRALRHRWGGGRF